MIARYTREEMGKIWTERSRYAYWLEVEWAVSAEVAAQMPKVLPQKEWRKLNRELKALLKAGGVAPERVNHFEAVTKHDVIAFTTAVAERIGPVARYVHYGLTSSDVVDTALALQVRAAGQVLLAGVDELQQALWKKAQKYQSLPTLGRTHGMAAEPTSFGLKFLGAWVELKRNESRLREALQGMAYGKLSGAVGVGGHFDPRFETAVLQRLGLKREPVSTQVVPRDRHAALLQAMALTAAGVERIAIELRHLQRTEVGEVREGFSAGQKGSSAMPHKRNPISSENLTGAARLLRAYAQAGIENVALWHERDISHSSVERVTFPDAFILLDYALRRMSGVIDRLEVDRDRVKANLERVGRTAYSGHYLLKLVERGVTREEAYTWVQSCAHKSLDSGRDFLELLEKHPEISKYLSRAEIKKLGSIAYQLRHVASIYREAKSASRSPKR